jgi:hypothetical protein
MTSDQAAAQALADLEQRVEAGLEAVRARAAEAKSRLESGMLNLRSRAGSDAPQAGPPIDLNWDLEAELAAPEPTPSFDDDLGALGKESISPEE